MYNYIYKRFHYNIQACRDLVPLVGMVGEEVTIFLAELRFVVQIRPGQPVLQIRFRPSSNTAFGSVPREKKNFSLSTLNKQIFFQIQDLRYFLNHKFGQ